MHTTLHTLELCLESGIKAKLFHAGTGPVILYVHGWAHAAGRWRRFQMNLSAPFTHVAVDLPGFGALKNEPVKRPYVEHYASFVRQVGEAVCRHFKQPLAGVVGHSLGGCAVAHAFRISDRDAITPSKLVLVDVPFAGVPALKPIVFLYPLIFLFFQLRFVLPFGLNRLAVKLIGLLTTIRWSAMDDDFVKDALAPRSTVLAGTLFAIAFHWLDLDVVPRSTDGVWLARGNLDWIMTRRTLERYAKAWSAHSQTFAGASHTPFLETPDAFAEWLDQVLTPLPGPVEKTAHELLR